MTGALLCMGYVAGLAEAAHRRAVAGQPVHPIALDQMVRMAAASLAFFIAARVWP